MDAALDAYLKAKPAEYRAPTKLQNIIGNRHSKQNRSPLVMTTLKKPLDPIHDGPWQNYTNTKTSEK